MTRGSSEELVCNYTEDDIVSKIASLLVDAPSIGEVLRYPDDARDILPRGPRIVYAIDGFSIRSVMLPWRDYSDVGWVALTSVISDLVSKASIPYACMIALGLSCTTRLSDLMELVKGLKEASSFYKVRVLGGDTNHSHDNWIAVSAIGFTTARRIPSRRGLKPGDYIIVTGKYGAMGFVALNGFEESGKHDWVVKYTKRPIVKIEIAHVIESFYNSITASMDVSDGLGYTLDTMSKLSGSTIEIINPPLTPSELSHDVCRNDPVCMLRYSLIGGEEYGVVLGVKKNDVSSVLKELQFYDIEATVVGRVRAGTPGLVYTGREIIVKRFDQFLKWE